jgi:flagellar hook-associated protein 2
MSTIQRVTGTNSGLDVDTLVKTAMTPYQTKVDKEVQNQKVLEYQQEQYKQIISDSSDFYDKYFDILKTGSMMSTSSYQTETFTPSDDGSKVTAKGLAGATIDNYTISVTQLAAKATDKLDLATETGTGKTINIGTAQITFDVVADGNTTVANYNAAVAQKKKDLTGSTVAADIAALADLNNNAITATYSQFTNSVAFTASAFGGSGFTLNNHTAVTDKYLEATIKNSSGDVYDISSKDKKTSNSVTIDNVQFDFKGVSTSTTSTVAGNLGDIAAIGGDVTPLTELTAIAEDGTTTTTTAADGTKTTSTTSGSTTSKRVTTTSGDTTTTTTDTTKPGITSVMDKSGVITTTDTSNAGYTLTTVKAGITTTTTKANNDGTVPITKKIETSGTTTTTTTTLKSGSTTTVKQDVKVGTNPATTTTTTELQAADGSTTTVVAADGTTTTTQLKVGSDGKTTKTVRINAGASQDVTTYNSPTSLTGSTDVSGLKDKIVKFVSDYNTLLQSINTKIYETRDKDYMPLTDAQKAKMTDSQITAWEKKAQTGLLRKDSDLQRITSAMKSAMSSVMSGSGLYLEKLGISPVQNYAEKNGMLTVDENKLTQALQDNAGNIKDLFTRSASTTDTTDKGGVLTQLASTLKSEFKTSTSSLSKKVGLDGTTTEYNNTLTTSISKKKQLISDLNSSLTDKENALYKKYSNLETAMQKLNDQQSSLKSMLG